MFHIKPTWGRQIFFAMLAGVIGVTGVLGAALLIYWGGHLGTATTRHHRIPARTETIHYRMDVPAYHQALAYGFGVIMILFFVFATVFIWAWIANEWKS